MPIIEKSYLFNDVQCSYIFISKNRDTLPACLSEDLVLFLKKNALLQKAGQNACGEKAAFLGKNLITEFRIQNIKLLVMDNWLSCKQPATPYCSNGFTTGANYHALCYFEFNKYFFACDLNTNSKDSPYLQIFSSERQGDVFNLLNAVYACKDIYLLDIHQEWWNMYKIEKTKEFNSLLSLESFSCGKEQKALPSFFHKKSDVKKAQSENMKIHVRGF